MKKNIFTLSVMILIILLFSISRKLCAQNNKDEQAIKETALNYIEGWYSADTSRMGKALSPDLKKRGFKIDPKTSKVIIYDASYAQMIEWTGQGTNILKQNPNIKIDIKIIEIGKNIANVKTITPDFIDYILSTHWV